MKNENRPVEWAALGKEEAIVWDEDRLHLTASHPHASRAWLEDPKAPMVEHALAYAMNGRPVFPCDEREGLRAKAPLTKTGFKAATLDADLIRSWWGKRPNALIGSPVPVGLVCIDIDPRNGATLPMLELLTGQLPDTQAVLSGRMDGGIHLFFWRPFTDFGGGLPPEVRQCSSRSTPAGCAGTSRREST